MQKIVSVVGPTASGKTGLAIELAKRFDGEVISADSRQVYRGLDIGTAKVKEEEMNGVPHHLLDVADVTEVYTAADFKHDGEQALTDLWGRGKLPIIAGGTFFYIDVLLGRIELHEVPPNKALRAELEVLSTEELFKRLEITDPARAMSIDADNRRRLIRALEIADALGSIPDNQSASPYDVLTIGLEIDMATHGEVVKQRLIERLGQGMIAEAQQLLAQGVTHERLEDLGLEYRYVSRHLRGELSYEALIDELSLKIRQYAKRQLTWLKRDQSIQWFRKDDPKVLDTVFNFLEPQTD